MRTFIFNGVSSEDHNLIINKIDRPVLPALRENKVTVPGRDGAYDFGNNNYEETKVGIDVTLVDPLDEPSLMRALGAWLKNKGYLSFSDEPDRNYLGRIYSVIYPEHTYRIATFKLIFVCDPFTYTDSETIDNPIEYDSGYNYDTCDEYQNSAGFEWLYDRQCSGLVNTGLPTDIVITITDDVVGVKVTHEESGKYLDIDVELTLHDVLIIDTGAMTITKNGVNVLSSLSPTSEFFHIQSGENSLCFTGNTYGCTVEYTWVIIDV